MFWGLGNVGGDMDLSVTRGSGAGVKNREPVLELLINVSFFEPVPGLLQLLFHSEELLRDLGDLLLCIQKVAIQGLPQLGIPPEAVDLTYNASVTYVSKAVIDCELLATTPLQIPPHGCGHGCIVLGPMAHLYQQGALFLTLPHRTHDGGVVKGVLDVTCDDHLGF
jgi:hypothetical protein